MVAPNVFNMAPHLSTLALRAGCWACAPSQRTGQHTQEQLLRWENSSRWPRQYRAQARKKSEPKQKTDFRPGRLEIRSRLGCNENMSPGSRQTWLQRVAPPVLSVVPWRRWLASRCLNFLICKTGIIIGNSQGWREARSSPALPNRKIMQATCII